MEERSSQITVVVGASGVAEDLRRSLVRQGVAHAGVTTHLRGLRRSIILGDRDLVVLCIALDRSTISRHGTSIQQLLADHGCLQQTVVSVGLLDEIGLTGEAAQMGCDVYVHDSRQAAKAVRQLARRWNRRRITGTREAVIERGDRAAWMWGTDKLPAELAPLIEPPAGEGLDRDLTGSLKADSVASGPTA